MTTLSTQEWYELFNQFKQTGEQKKQLELELNSIEFQIAMLKEKYDAVITDYEAVHKEHSNLDERIKGLC